MATESEKWAARLLETVPTGASTCSKAAKLLPEEPGVIVRGKGCRIWDADGREFIDFKNGLGPITLGYTFPPVDDAIRKQLQDGLQFGNPHPLECEVAEELCDLIPCAEQARFLKTGGEALAACFRLARFHTGREHIIQIGYNGWLNSLASGGQTLPGRTASSSPPGVPVCLSALHHACAWNDLAALENMFKAHPGQIAAVAVSADYPDMAEGKTFYPALRKITETQGSVLIFDEIVTGFRIAKGGVQEYFSTLPDLSVFSKGMANGMPISVYCGKRKIMSKLNEVTVSSTMAGETISLAATKAVMKIYREQDVCGHLWKQGEKMWTGLNEIFTRLNIPAEFKGFWPCPALQPLPDAPKNFRERFFRAAFAHGVSLYNVSYVNFSHQEQDIQDALERLEKACKSIQL